MKRHIFSILAILSTVLLAPSCSGADQTGMPAQGASGDAKTVGAEAAGANALVSYDARFHPVIADDGMVVAQDKLAAQVGRDMLAGGGNAVDAAVATGFALAVTHPQAGNLGGGGFMLIALAEDRRVIALDFREAAPARAARDMFLDEHREVDTDKARFSHLSAGVPGSVLGLLEAQKAFGRLSLSEVLKPAIELAEGGFPVSRGLAHALRIHERRLKKDPSSAAYFYKPDGSLYAYGDILVQADLAETLRRIAKDGAAGFYDGETAALIAAEMEQNGGIVSRDDLRTYDVVYREPVRGSFRGYEIYSMPPPSSGGVHILQMLNVMETYDLRALGHNSANYLHVLIEAMRRAYADRAVFLGDPDFVDVPVDELISKDYASQMTAQIDLTKATPSESIRPELAVPGESPDTTHYSVMDDEGNAVSVTTTLNFTFGSGMSVDGAGFLLNNEMDDFSAKPGAPNGYGLIGGAANAIAPGKRPLSSMSPTIVFREGAPYLATGSPGGSTIITTVLQILLNVLEFDMNVMEASAQPRIHHQWLPDIVMVEPDLSRDTLDLLRDRGFAFRRSDAGAFERNIMGRANSILYEDGHFYGAADPRSVSAGVAGLSHSAPD